MSYQLTTEKFLSDEELDRLLKTFKRNQESDFHKVLILETLLKTGARAGEIRELTKKDAIISSKALFIKGKKGSKNRLVYLNASLWERMMRHINTLPSDDAKIFPITWSAIRNYWYAYRPVKKSLHCLRHTFALMLYKKTKDIKLVQLSLGHVSPSNTHIYLDFAYNEEEMKRAIW